MGTYELFKDLSNSSGVSGYENRKKDIIISAFKDYVDEIEVDSLGNVICIKKGEGKNNPKILLAAHMDEIGLMVNGIEEDGLLKFTSVGGIDPRTIVSQEVTVHGREDLFGVIGAKPPHIQKPSDFNKAYKMEDLTIDIGMEKNEVEKLVRIGDTVTIRRKFTDLKNNWVYGKALDNKAGLASLLQCAIELENVKHQADVYFVATVQEEVTMLGGFTTAYSIDPDIGIAVDVGFGRTPELQAEGVNDMDKGPSLALGGNIHPNLRKHMVKIAGEYNVPTQTDVVAGGTGTDARAIQITRAGIPTLCLSIPLRYMHTSVEVVSVTDVKNTGRLLSFFINSIKADELEGLLCY